MRKLSGVFVMLMACGLGGDEQDDFWSDTHEDDGTGDDVAARTADKQVAINPGKTDDAELIEELPVGQREASATRRIVMQLGPGELPRLMKGDRLITPAEAQVTTRCDIGQNAAGCDYNPTVRAQLIITGNRTDTNPGGQSQSIAIQTQTCSKDAHHCMFVFGPSEASKVLDAGLPCVTSNTCYVNLVMWAWDGAARSGGQDKILVGGNDGDYLANGRVEGDVSRLMVVREHGVGAADRASRETSGGGGKSVNTNANPVVIYSHRLKPDNDLEAGEQFLVEAKLVTSVTSRARFSTEMFLTKNPDATDGNGVDKISPSQISEQNGVNCNTGRSCVTRKVAVFRVDAAISGPVYVNVVAKSAVPGGGNANVTVNRNAGWVRSVRYRATMSQ